MMYLFAIANSLFRDDRPTTDYPVYSAAEWLAAHQEGSDNA
jgi:hypothetical protein